DDDLLQVAAAGSAAGGPTGPSRADLTRWVATLPTSEKDACLVRLMQGETSVTAELLRRFRTDQASSQGTPARSPEARTVGMLLDARDRRGEEERRRAAEEAAKAQERRQREQAAARSRHLDALAGREDSLWVEVGRAIATKQPGQYDHAIDVLKD